MYGDSVQHSRAVANPRFTTVPPCSSSHCTVASNAEAEPLTVTGLRRPPRSRLRRSAGESMDTGASVVSRLAAATSPEVGTPSSVAARDPSTSKRTGRSLPRFARTV